MYNITTFFIIDENNLKGKHFIKSINRLALVGGPVGIFKHMAEDNVKPDIRTVAQILESLPADTQTEEARWQLTAVRTMKIFLIYW